MADQLAIWNVALAHLGERRLASLQEPREPARVLNDEWDAAVRGCLELATWSFATRTAQIASTGNGQGPFQNALPKPADWLRTADISADGALTAPLDGYIEEGRFWFATPGQIWVRYVSMDPAYGYAIDRWPQQFADLVALALAARCCRRLTGAADMLGDLIKLRENAAHEALAFEETTAARQYPAPTGGGENRLQAYNDALTYLGRARALSLTQTTDTVRALNDQYRSALRWCLQRARWGFAAITAGLADAGNVGPRVGYRSVFIKPSDHILTLNIASDPNLTLPVPRYIEEGGYFFSDQPYLAIRYVSADLGSDPSRWPPYFTDLLALRLAELVCGRLAEDPKTLGPNLVKMRDEAEAAARAIEAESVGRLYPTSSPVPLVQVYNDALSHIGLPRIGSLTEVSETVRTLNDQYQTSLRWALQQAWWSFALRAQTIAASAGQGTGDAYPYLIAKPQDWVSTVELAADPRFLWPLLSYADEGASWLTDVGALSVRYVSSDPAFGGDPTRWPAYFTDVLALRLAEKCAVRLGADQARATAAAEMLAGAVGQARLLEDAALARTLPPADQNAAVQLRIYNEALGYLGQPRVASLAEVGERTRALNEVWRQEVLWCLQQGPWTFATRSLTLAAVDGVVPLYGYEHAYAKPIDWVRTVGLMVSGDWREPLMHYTEGDGVWYTNTVGLAVRYVSAHEEWGFALTNWSPTFAGLVAIRLAERCCMRLTKSTDLTAGLVALRDRAMKTQRAEDAINAEPAFAPRGSWTRSRMGGLASRAGYSDAGRLARRAELGLAGTNRQLAGSDVDNAGFGPALPAHDGSGLAGTEGQQAGSTLAGAGAEPTIGTDDLSKITLADQEP